LKITLPAKPSAITFESDRAALVVVDMQNSFCKKGGMMDYMGKFNAAMSERVIGADRKVIRTCRKKDIKIIYFRMTYGPEEGPDSPFYWKEGGRKAMRENPELRGKFLTEGTWDWAIVDELKPEGKDIIVNKSRFSGFVNTELDAKLKELNIKYLLFAGVFTNICVESTVRDAAFRDYFPILIEDACGNSGPAYIQKATVWNIASVFGWVSTSDKLNKTLNTKL
jgi:ureidoacrylate peracid hydrolase